MINWERHTNKDYDYIIQQLQLYKPLYIGFDTETTGLNIYKDKPFLFIISFLKNNNPLEGVVFTIDYDSEKIKPLLLEMCKAQYIIGCNTKYDLHMLANGGSEFPFQQLIKNKAQLTDVRILARLITPCDTAESHGFRNSLKSLACTYINPNANFEEKEISVIKTQLKREREVNFSKQLRPLKMTLSKLKDMVLEYGVQNLDDDLKRIYTNYKMWYKEPTYEDIYKKERNKMLEYALRDGEYTLHLFLILLNKYFSMLNDYKDKYPNAINIFYEENKLIEVYYRQERVGFCIDTKYLYESRDRVRDMYNSLKEKLYSYLGEQINPSQHVKLREIFINKFNVPRDYFIEVDKENNEKETLNKATIIKLKKIPSVKPICEIIEQMRRCEKWLSTYILGIIEQVEENGINRIFPTTDSVGAVSGRVTSNFQQIPKEALFDSEGNEIFHPRKLVIPSGNGYSKLVFQDFDQMELRVQAHYTILFNNPDTTLCSMFVPYNHYMLDTNTNQNVVFQFNNEFCNNHIETKDSFGNSVWKNGYDNSCWKPIDPHGILVVSALGLNENDKDFKHYRKAAKIINFAMIYGCSLKSLLSNTSLEDFDKDVITNLYNTFKITYKGVIKYQELSKNQITSYLNLANLYNRIYTFENSRAAYKICNYLIQGTCADLVKNVLIKLNNYLVNNNYKSRVLFSIHDEIVWELYDGEEHLIDTFKSIIKEATSWSFIPLTCGTDISTTNWAEAKTIG